MRRKNVQVHPREKFIVAELFVFFFRQRLVLHRKTLSRKSKHVKFQWPAHHQLFQASFGVQDLVYGLWFMV